MLLLFSKELVDILQKKNKKELIKNKKKLIALSLIFSSHLTDSKFFIHHNLLYVSFNTNQLIFLEIFGEFVMAAA